MLMGRAEKIATHMRRAALSVLVGLLGGMFCGSAILSLCALSGRIQTTGANYVGYWDYGLLLVGALYGGPLGAILGPIGSAILMRTVSLKRAMGPAVLSTVLGGYAGALITPLLGVLTGIAGFLIALVMLRLINLRQLKPLGSRN